MTAGVVADRYPAVVSTTGGAPMRDARVVLTRPEGDEPGQLWVWRDRRPEPELVLHTEWVPAETTIPHGRGAWHVVTGDGAVYVVERGRGCGCGSTLRRWKPWQPYQLAGMPPEVQR